MVTTKEPKKDQVEDVTTHAHVVIPVVGAVRSLIWLLLPPPWSKVKYVLLGILAIVGLVAAQSLTVQKPVECVDTATLLRGLSGSNYREKPIWWGIEPGATVSRYSLFVNEQTKTWTLIQFDDKIACILGTGEASTQIFSGPEI